MNMDRRVRGLLRALCVISGGLGVLSGTTTSPTYRVTTHMGVPALGPPLLFVIVVGTTMVLASMLPDDTRLSTITSPIYRRASLVASLAGFVVGWVLGAYYVGDALGAGAFGVILVLLFSGCCMAYQEGPPSAYHALALHEHRTGQSSETPSSPLHHRHGDPEKPEEEWFEFHEAYRTHATDHEEFEV